MEPQASCRRAVREILQAAGCILRVARDVDDALEVNPFAWFFDLLITDLDGCPARSFGLIRTMRLPRPWLPVVTMTNRPTRVGTVGLHRRDEGPLVLLRKPVTVVELIDAVTAVLVGRHQ